MSTTTIARGAYTNTYDPQTGQLTSLGDPDGGVLGYVYDGSLVTQESYTGTVDWAVSRTYDASFRVDTQSVDGDPIGFAYDDDSMLTGVGDELLTHDPITGLLTDVALGDVTTSMDYDGFGQPDLLLYENTDGVLYEASFVRDDLGRIVEKMETIATGVTTTWGYVYDDTGRLVEVTQDGQLHESFAYDANSNREVTTPGAEVTASYDDQDRLLAWGDLSFTYGENGELESRFDGGSNETTLYAYDELSNLTRVDLPDGTVIEYVIDGRNRRVGKKVDGVLVQGLAYGDQLNPVAEYDGAGNLITRFVYGSRGHVPDYMVKDGSTYRIVSDHLGSVRAVVDTVTGDVVQRIEYDAWGKVLEDTNPGWQPFGFAGGVYEAATGLVRFGARSYDGELGRWTSKEPLGLGAGQNLYSYAWNNPIDFIDQDGAHPGVVAGAGAGIGVAAVVGGLYWAYQCNINPDACTPDFDFGFPDPGLGLATVCSVAAHKGLARAIADAWARGEVGYRVPPRPPRGCAFIGESKFGTGKMCHYACVPPQPPYRGKFKLSTETKCDPFI